MSPKSQMATFYLTCADPRVWLVARSANQEPHIVEMWQAYPNGWFARVWLIPGEYHCRYYSGNDQNVIYYGPARTGNSADSGMDALVSIKIPPEKIASQPTHILLVEDNPNTLRTYAKLLRMDGHLVHTANGYQAALDVAKRERLDLAICDIALWDGNGCDLLGELQKLQPLKAIAVTGYALADEVENYRAAGFDEVLSKPLRHSQITSAISLLIPAFLDSPSAVEERGQSVENHLS